MREERLSGVDGVRVRPDRPNGWGVLTVAGSSGRVDTDRARTFASAGLVADTFRWFGGPGQPAGPFDVPIEQFQERVQSLAAECDHLLLSGTSFGAEAVLLSAAHTPGLEAVVAFAPSDVVWPWVRPDGSVTSHWTLGGEPLPFVPFLDGLAPDGDPPSFAAIYRDSYAAAAPETRAAASIPVEHVPATILVAGGDDRVWPSVEHARRIEQRRMSYGLDTTVITVDDAGHRAVLPGEAVVVAGQRMARGGDDMLDRVLGGRAWAEIARLWDDSHGGTT